MNYTLTLNLEGFDNVDHSLDDMIDKSGILGGDVKKLGFFVKDSMAASRVHISNAAKAMDWWDAGIKRATISMAKLNSLKGLREVGGKDLAKVLGMGDFNENVLGKMHGPDLDGKMRARQAAKDMADRSSFFKNMSLMMGPVFAPGSPLTTMFAARQGFSAMMTNTGQGLMGKVGLSGIGGAAGATGILVVAATTVGLAFKSLQMTIKGVDKAIQNAFHLYTQSAQQGVSSSFFQQRQSAASILGVSGNPNQIFMFGNALKYVYQQTAIANGALSGSARKLAETSMRFKILENDMMGLFSVIAVQLSPTLDNLTDALSRVVRGLIITTQVFGEMSNTLKIFDFLYQKLVGVPPIPKLQTGMKQLPASSWEHMGLAIGGTGQSTVTQEVKKSNTYLKTIADAVRNRDAIKNAFGFDPTISNP